MGKVHAVLLVPAEGDPLGLLREGARVAGLKGVPGQERWELGWRVSDGQGGYMAAWDSGTFNNLHETLALVFAWDGGPVAEGCDRFTRAAEWQPPCDDWVEDMLSGDGDPEAVDGLGTLILLDADNREIGGNDE